MTPKNISSRFMSIGIFSALALLPAAFGGIPAANAQVGEDIPTTIEQPSAYPDGAMDMDMDAESNLLGFGSRGSDVEELQSFLQEQGYYQDEIDGVYGQNTYSAVREFQSDNDLSVDGIVGQETWSALNDTVGVTSPNPNYDTTPYQNPAMTQPGGTMNTPNRNPNMNQPGSTGPFTSPGTNNIAPQAQ